MARALKAEDWGIFEEEDEVRRALFSCYSDGTVMSVCRGERKGCKRTLGFGPCEDCYTLFHGDHRTNEQVMHDMQRGNA
jgi:hypothetical protein